VNVLLILVPVALLLSLGFVVGFVRAVRGGQFDDLETPAHRILLEDNEGDPK
jgi:cbb3-type cytochrome oxidase maturation protein